MAEPEVYEENDVPQEEITEEMIAATIAAMRDELDDEDPSGDFFDFIDDDKKTPLEPADACLIAANDALFDCDYATAEAECRKALKLRPVEKEAYVLLNIIAKQQGDLAKSAAVCSEWGKACGTTFNQLQNLIEACFLLGDLDGMARAAKDLAAKRPPREGSVSGANPLYSKIYCAAMLADAKLSEAADSLLNSCEGFDLDEDFETLIDVLSAWADVSRGPEKTLPTLESYASAQAKSSDSLYEKDVSYLARALLCVYALENGQAEVAAKWLPRPDEKVEDPNIAAVMALIAKVTENAGDFEKFSDMAHGCSILLKKRLLLSN